MITHCSVFRDSSIDLALASIRHPERTTFEGDARVMDINIGGQFFDPHDNPPTARSRVLCPSLVRSHARDAKRLDLQWDVYGDSLRRTRLTVAEPHRHIMPSGR